MTRLSLIAVLAGLVLGACATASSSTKYSYTPKTVVTVKTVQGKAAQANYQAPPEEPPAGSGGGVQQ